jgi:hypothetical protein
LIDCTSRRGWFALIVDPLVPVVVAGDAVVVAGVDVVVPVVGAVVVPAVVPAAAESSLRVRSIDGSHVVRPVT